MSGLPFCGRSSQVSISECPTPVLPTFVITTFRRIRELHAPRGKMANEGLRILRRVPIGLVIRLQARSLFCVVRLNDDDGVIVVRLRARLLKYLRISARLNVLRAKDCSLPDEDVRVIRHSVRLVVYSMGEVRYFRLIAFPIATARVVVARTRAPLLICNVNDLRTCRGNECALHVLILSNLVVRDDLRE